MRWMVVLWAVSMLGGSAAAGADKKTERLWKANCASCHGADGKAQTEQGAKMGVADLTTADWQKKYTDDQIKKSILEGTKKEEGGKKKEMDPFKDKLKPEQVEALVAFVRSLAK